MTCIIGFTDKSNNITYMGCDSCVSWDYTNATINLDKKKVFKLKDINNVLVGFSGSIRDLNLLHYATGLIDKKDEHNIDEEYIITYFIPQIVKTIESNGRCYASNNQKLMDSVFLVAYKDKLWKISNDYSVCSTTDNFDAVGSGSYHALASMETMSSINMTPIEKIHKALQVASKFVSSVAPPFYILNTKDDEIIEFKDCLKSKILK